ncbi:FAD-dependent oxidoreductase [Candidatus Thiothrix sp. Deng01]|uniref:FAD-dependent oxidoreductase n=1 Tax=Candidatus Thiothrix phosphatis TaxID=3112415 RepID=A0ABU6D108_9GAMM|nr:FAD-dependent oxidoreductase [Candidatus Thiothrix sp. Deng01]MEB4592750.1 FAD-dependent oxidoreductase [Candidatus Thiothrix sp. Deng01]
MVGAGAAGLGCALATAARGTEVVLVESSASTGGTVSQALLHTIGGLFDDQGGLLNPGLCAELVGRLVQASPQTKKRRIGKTWVLDVDPAIYTQVVTGWVAETPAIKVFYQANINSISIADGCITQASIRHHEGAVTLHPHALLDATGNADIVRRIDPSLVSEGLALAGYILQIRGVAPNALQFPQSIALLREIRKAAAAGQLPEACATVWLDTGVYPDEIYAKFNLSASSWQPGQMQQAAAQLLAFLHTFPAFASAAIHAHGQLGIRDGGRIQGEYCLTEADVVTGRQFADAACQAAWPIEHWHPDKGVTLEYLPAGQSYAIPLRCLQVAGFRNLWAAGKCLSAEPRAQASARVVGTCWAMGEAVGKHLVGSSE